MINLTIVILAYNSEASITTCIDSLLRQNFEGISYKFFIINDGSRDKTKAALLNVFNRIDSEKIQIVNFSKNHGNGFCKNFAIENSKSEYICFVDDHAILEDPLSIKKLYSKLVKDKNAAGICGNYYSSQKNDWNVVRDIRRYQIYRKADKALLLSTNHFVPFSIVFSIINKNKITENCFPVNFKQNAAEDTFFQLKLHEQNAYFLYEPSVKIKHDHNVRFMGFLQKQKRELAGFMYILDAFANSTILKKSYLPGFFSAPTLLWIVFIFHVLYGGRLSMFFLLLLLTQEIIIFLPIFFYHELFSLKLKAFLYCLSSEAVKPPIIFFRTIFFPKKLWGITKTVFFWEIGKFKYFYRYGLTKSRLSQTPSIESWG